MSNHKPLVDICCATYNHENFISDAIEGFLKQITTFPFRVLIHDDASSDETASIIKQYAEHNQNIIFPIYQTVNQYSKGNYPIERILIPMANSKYIALCEGDDYWIDPYKLQKQVDFLENNKGFVLVHTNFNHYNTETGRLIEQANNAHNQYYRKYEKKIYNKKDLFIDILHGQYFIKTCTSMFVSKKIKRILNDDLTFFNGKFLMGDTFIFCELSQLGLVHYMPEVTAVANKLIVSAKNNPNSFKRILFSKSLSELAMYLLQKHSFVDEYNLSIERHLDFILENALRYDQKRWIDDIKLKYKENIKFKHRVLILLSRKKVCRILVVAFIDIFVKLPKRLLRKARRAVSLLFRSLFSRPQ